MFIYSYAGTVNRQHENEPPIDSPSLSLCPPWCGGKDRLFFFFLFAFKSERRQVRQAITIFHDSTDTIPRLSPTVKNKTEPLKLGRRSDARTTGAGEEGGGNSQRFAVAAAPHGLHVNGRLVLDVVRQRRQTGVGDVDGAGRRIGAAGQHRRQRHLVALGVGLALGRFDRALALRLVKVLPPQKN